MGGLRQIDAFGAQLGIQRCFAWQSKRTFDTGIPLLEALLTAIRGTRPHLLVAQA